MLSQHWSHEGQAASFSTQMRKINIPPFSSMGRNNSLKMSNQISIIRLLFINLRLVQFWCNCPAENYFNKSCDRSLEFHFCIKAAQLLNLIMKNSSNYCSSSSSFLSLFKVQSSSFQKEKSCSDN